MKKQQDQDFGSSTVSITLPYLGTKQGIPSFIGKETAIESLKREFVSLQYLKGCLEIGQTRISDSVLLIPSPARFNKGLLLSLILFDELSLYQTRSPNFLSDLCLLLVNFRLRSPQTPKTFSP